MSLCPGQKTSKNGLGFQRINWEAPVTVSTDQEHAEVSVLNFPNLQPVHVKLNSNQQLKLKKVNCIELWWIMSELCSTCGLQIEGLRLHVLKFRKFLDTSYGQYGTVELGKV